MVSESDGRSLHVKPGWVAPAREPGLTPGPGSPTQTRLPAHGDDMTTRTDHENSTATNCATADTATPAKAVPGARTRLRRGPVGDIEPGYPSRTKWPDHMFELHPGMGVHIARDTKRKFGHVLCRLEEFGCTVRQLGDTEANLAVPEHAILAVARMLKITKANHVSPTQRARGES